MISLCQRGRNAYIETLKSHMPTPITGDLDVPGRHPKQCPQYVICAGFQAAVRHMFNIVSDAWELVEILPWLFPIKRILAADRRGICFFPGEAHGWVSGFYLTLAEVEKSWQDALMACLYPITGAGIIPGKYQERSIVEFLDEGQRDYPLFRGGYRACG